MKSGIRIAACFLFMLLSPFTVHAEDVTLSLDISAYDTFGETIEVTYSGPQPGIATLNDYNSYTKALDLEPGIYDIALTIRNDTLQLYQLEPEQFTVEVLAEDNQEIVINVSDNAGLARGSNDYIHTDMVVEEIVEETEPETSVSEYIYKWGGTELELGWIKVTAPDITGMKSISFSLEAANGTYTYLLNREYDFTAIIELPYGSYTEIGCPEVIAEDGIMIPEGTVFEYDYYQNTFGRTYLLNAQQTYIETLPGMKLRMRAKDGNGIEIKNLYQFSGNSALLSPEKHEVGTGHYEVLETDETTMSPSKDDSKDSTPTEEMSHPGIVQITICILAVVLIVVLIGAGAKYFIYKQEEHNG